MSSDLSWMDDSLCAELPMWPSMTAAWQVTYCRQCPVRRECLEWILAAEDAQSIQHSDTVAGGLTAQQRRKLLRKRREQEAVS